ncbi:MAG: hypothetical protein IT372_41040 [Polyangiaceae bacterium]|nr:hypothetical protein [Polyangiaceae bacterium]
MKRTFIATMSLGACLLATAAAQAAAGQHPRIEGYDHRWEYDVDYRESAYVLTVQAVSDGIDVVPVEISFRSFHPELGCSTFTASSRALGPGVVDQAQVDAFKAYGIAIIGCGDALPGAHAYDAPAALNPASPVPLADFAGDVGWVRSMYFECADSVPPPLDVCDAGAAPEVLSLTPDSQTFYYVDIALQNGNELTLGFEWDGGEWQLAEQYGAADACQGQLDTFTDYTMSILTSPSCAADWVYTPAEETEISWYVCEAESFCQEVMYNL